MQSMHHLPFVQGTRLSGGLESLHRRPTRTPVVPILTALIFPVVGVCGIYLSLMLPKYLMLVFHVLFHHFGVLVLVDGLILSITGIFISKKQLLSE